MKQALTRNNKSNTYYFANSVKIYGQPQRLRGNVTGLSGDVSGLRGYVTGLYGDVTGLYGDVSGLYGNIDDCELTEAERRIGVDVAELTNTNTLEG